MKTRNSKAFHNHETSSANNKSFEHLVDVIMSKIDSNKAERLAISAFKEIIERCYNNRQAQQELCKALCVPFFPGPIALNNLPNSFFEQEYLTEEDIEDSIMNQISYLFEYLKKTKEYFYCWIIYYNQELKLLTVKMMKKYELKENIELLNSKYCMIGIFVDREVSLNVKKEAKYSFINTNKIGKEMQKTTAYSCYQNMSSPDALKKIKNKQKKLNNELSRKSQNTYSLKGFNSASITNSSSFKNELSQKESENELEENFTSEVANIKANQKMRNFKRKKEKLLMFTDLKIRKSVSTKNEKSKSHLKFKSLDKIEFHTKNSLAENFKNQEKPHGLRSISNADKYESYKKLDSNKIEFHKIKKDFEAEKKENISNSLSKHRILSKNNKAFSSCGSLNSSNQSQNFETKHNDEKIMPNFRRKISGNGASFKKKKIDPIKFVNSTKNSFEFK